MEKRERDIESGLRRQVEKMGGKQRVFVRSGNEERRPLAAVVPRYHSDDGQMVTGGRCSAVCSLNRYHLKPSNRKGKRADGNEVTSFLYRLLKITPTHMKTGPREGAYAHYRKNSGASFQ